jgi:hypothetical protein
VLYFIKYIFIYLQFFNTLITNKLFTIIYLDTHNINPIFYSSSSQVEINKNARKQKKNTNTDQQILQGSHLVLYIQ